MPGGPITPISAIPMSQLVFPRVHVGDGGVSPQEAGLGLAAGGTWGEDPVWRLRFTVPVTLPTGTPKLRLLSLADAITGNIVFEPRWKSVAPSADPSTGALGLEGNTTIIWAAGNDDQYRETKVTLDIVTVPAANEIVVMDLVFKDSGTTLAVPSTHHIALVWE